MNRRSMLRLIAVSPLAPLLASAAVVAPKVAPEFYRVWGGPLGGAFVRATSVIARSDGRYELRRFMPTDLEVGVEVLWFRLRRTSDGIPTLEWVSR